MVVWCYQSVDGYPHNVRLDDCASIPMTIMYMLTGTDRLQASVTRIMY